MVKGTETVDVTIFAWQDAPIDTGERTIFAVGDVHGLDEHLSALHSTFRRIASSVKTASWLILLGDLIDGGAASAEVLNRVTSDTWGEDFERKEYLMGNHEILMRLFLESETAKSKEGWEKWIAKHRADTTLKSFGIDDYAPSNDEELAALRESLLKRLGPHIWQMITSMRSHLLVGNLAFVHAGINADLDSSQLTTFLSQPWDQSPYELDQAHWAWMQKSFLEHEGPAKSGRLVIHGHTPETKIKAMLGPRYPGAHVMTSLRLGLDAGTTQNESRHHKIAAAQLEPGRYRIILVEG